MNYSDYMFTLCSVPEAVKFFNKLQGFLEKARDAESPREQKRNISLALRLILPIQMSAESQLKHIQPELDCDCAVFEYLQTGGAEWKKQTSK